MEARNHASKHIHIKAKTHTLAQEKQYEKLQ